MFSTLFRLIYFIKRKSRPFLASNRIHFIGDSHVEVFWYMEFSPFYFWKIIPKIKIVHGATASGLSNPNSKTKAVVNFKYYIRKEVKKNDYVLFQLGEVDCGFTIWFRSIKYNISIEKQTDLAINNYTSLINETKKFTKNKIVICSAVLPTIKDGSYIGEVANLRKEVSASLVERTLLTKKFNARMKLFAKKNGFYFFDLDEYLFNKKTQTIHKIFLNEDPKNHHLNSKELSKILNKELNKLLFFISFFFIF